MGLVSDCSGRRFAGLGKRESTGTSKKRERAKARSLVRLASGDELFGAVEPGRDRRKEVLGRGFFRRCGSRILQVVCGKRSAERAFLGPVCS
jgi:hypothetical protein